METIAASKLQRQRWNALLLRWHRRIGLVACLGVLMWALSGISHPLMSRLQPRAVTFAAPQPAMQLKGALPLSTVLQAQGLARIDWVRVVSWHEGMFYQVALPDTVELAYFDVSNGRRVSGADRRYAEFLARHYLGDHASPVMSIASVTAFDDEYTYINRLLPAYRVSFGRDDGMRVYVDTASSRLGTMVDTPKSLLSSYFKTLHTWSFLDHAPGLRLAAMSILLICAFLTALMGISIYVMRFKEFSAKADLRRTHRLAGIAVSMSTLLLSFSGGCHLWTMSQQPRPSASPRDTGFVAEDFRLPLQALHGPGEETIRHIASARIRGETFYRIEYTSKAATPHHADNHPPHADHHAKPATSGPSVRPVFIHASTGAIQEQGEDLYLRGLLEKFSDSAVDDSRSPSTVARFGGEYGFVFKRLPVQRFEADDGTRYYIDPSSGTLAAHLTDGDAREGWIFAYLHKFEWLSPLSTVVRDVAAACFALGNAAVGVLGIVLFRRRRSSLRGTAR